MPLNYINAADGMGRDERVLTGTEKWHHDSHTLALLNRMW